MPPSLSRRKALRLSGSTMALGVVSGCLGRFQGGSVGVLIENGDDQQHILDVVFEQGDETVFDERFTVEAGEETRTSDAVTAGEYAVSATLGSGESEQLDFHMNGCTDNSLSVYIDGNGELQLGITTVCD